MRRLRIIKCVAGAGKTTESLNILKENENGLYLAYTNSVVDDIKYKGYLAKTIDSLFLTYIIPKFVSLIPIINKNSNIKYLDSRLLKDYQKNILNIKINDKGEIFNRNTKTKFSLYTSNEDLHKSNTIMYSKTIKQIFTKNDLVLTQNCLDNISHFLIINYKKEIQELLQKRFSYIIIDEAQDLSGYKEEFAKLIYESNIDFFALGDDNQNIINNGTWFEKQIPTEYKNKSFRTSDNICDWIRKNIGIEIYGNETNYFYYPTNYNDVKKLDNGHRVLLYVKKGDSNKNLLDNWKGEKVTIKSAKGSTIDKDIVILGQSLSKKNMYTALTRTKRNVYSTVTKISK